MSRMLVFVAVVLLAACAQLLAPNQEPPFIRGTITAHDPQRGFLVEAQPAGAYRVDAAWIRQDADTKIQQGGTRGVRLESLATGQTVSVWIRGPVMESLPVQVVAAVITVE